MPVAEAPKLGEGVYTFSEAVRILRAFDAKVSVRQLRYWTDTNLVLPTYHIEDESILNFDDLISLEVIRRFRNEGTSLHRIRRLLDALRQRYPALIKPFAYQKFYTDGASVWAEEIGETGPIAVELVGRRPSQRVWTGAIRTFAADIQFEGEDEHASTWHLTPWVDINPKVQFGAPVVAGTRVPVRTIEANLEVGSPKEVADWYGLTVRQVEGVRNFAIR